MKNDYTFKTIMNCELLFDYWQLKFILHVCTRIYLSHIVFLYEVIYFIQLEQYFQISNIPAKIDKTETVFKLQINKLERKFQISKHNLINQREN